MSSSFPVPRLRVLFIALAMLGATLFAVATASSAAAATNACAYISDGRVNPAPGPWEVIRIDLADNTLGDGLPLALVNVQGPRSPSIAITPAGSAVLAGQQVAGNDQISVFDLTDDSRSVAGVNVQWLRDIAVSPDGSYALAVSAGLTVFNGAASLKAFSLSDLSSPTALGGINLPAAIGSFNNAVAVAITPDGNKAYVTSPHFGVVYAIDVSNPSSLVLGATINTGTAGNSIAISSDGATAYMTQGTGVLPIDVATDTPGSPIALPAGNAARIEINGTTAYVLTSGAGATDDSLTLIDVSNPLSPTVGTPIVLGDGTDVMRALAVTEDASTAYVGATDSAGDPVMHVVDLGTETRDVTASDEITAALPSTLIPSGIVTGPCVFAADADGDGVTDDVDLCPSTPPGETVNADGCTGTQAIDNLDTAVADLVDSGDLTADQGEDLQGKLDGALDKLAEGKPDKAITKLEAFISKVEKWLNKTPPQVDADVGADLIAAAQGVIDAINSA